MPDPVTPASDVDLEVPLSQIEDAAGRLDGYVHRTSLLSSMTAARWVHEATGTRLADGLLYLKPEHLQKTGSFKARGMTNRIATLPDEARQRGAITLSAGNAGQAYAWAGAAAGVPVTVVMPEGAVRSKVEACLGYGARVILHGTHVGDTFAEMERIRDAEGLTFVHPFDDPAVIAGNGTVGLELVDDVPDVDVVVVGVGGGGLISGIASAVKARRPSARIVGVEPERSNAVSLALERNEIVTIQPQSVADGLARHSPGAGRWRSPGGWSTTSSCSTTPRSWPVCGSRWSGSSWSSNRPGLRLSLPSSPGGSRCRTASVSPSSCRVATSR